MYCLNHRIGILFRENLAKKSYELRYFFIDDNANLFYIVSLPRLQKVIRLSKNFPEIKSRLEKAGQRSFTLNKYQISQPKPYHSEAVLPFSNRTCIELRERQPKGEEKHYQIFGLIDEDTPLLFQQILFLTGRKKRENIKRKSVIEVEKEKQQKVLLQFFDKFVSNEDSFRMGQIERESSAQKEEQEQKEECKKSKEEDEDRLEDSQYEGEKVKGLAEGQGKQILIEGGITYSGSFRGGKKHGVGYLVNENLDTLECEFIDDELAGI